MGYPSMLRVGLAASMALAFAHAQRNTASIFGTVTDPSGASVPAVAINVTNDNTGVGANVITDVLGNFVVLDLPPAPYTLTATANGFKRYVRKNLVLQVDQRPQINVVLQVGDVNESVTVQATAPLLDPTHANIGGVVDKVNTEQLPLNGRQFLQLALLLPGVSPAAGGQTASTSGGPRSLAVQSGGNRSSNNTFLIDGADSFGFRHKNTSLRPSVAAIQEFKVMNSPYDAQYGVASGLTVSVITKSGTNALHGELFEFLRNDRLDARNFFNARKPPFRHNQYGGAVGGPISRNRTFFFGTYEGYKSRRGVAVGGVVPTTAQLAGDFTSETRNVMDPISNAPFPGKIIPASRIHDVAKRLNALWPAPNSPLATPNFINSSSSVLDEYQYLARLDHAFSSSWRAFGRYSISNVDTLEPTAIPKFGTLNLMTVQNAVVGSTLVLSPKTFLDLRIGYNREDQTNRSEQVGKQTVSSYGINGLNPPPELDGVPHVRVLGFNNLGDGTSEAIRVENSEQFVGNLTRIAGRHTLRVGTSVWLAQLNRVVSSINQRGFFSFTPIYSGLTHAVPDYLLGMPQIVARNVGAGRMDMRGTLFNAYVADDFRVSPRLTVSLGLRYELRMAFLDKQDRLSIFIPEGEGRIELAGNPNNGFTGRQNRALYPSPKRNFAPRVGLAYDLLGNGKTILRTGYGVFYNLAMTHAQFLGSLNPPFVLSQGFVADPPRGVFLNIANPFPSQPGAAGGQAGGMGITPWFLQAYMQQWSFGGQRELAANLALDVTYLGSKGTHLDSTRLLNQGALVGASYGAYTQQFPKFGLFTTVDSFGDSIYHSLQAKLTRRFSAGATFITSYNFGHSIDNGPGIVAGSGSMNGLAMDNRNVRQERGNSDFDLRHRLTFSGIYELPFGRGHHLAASGLLGRLAEGWQLSGIWSVQTGFPFTIQQSGNRSGTNAPQERANHLCNGTLPGDERRPERWFNTACYSASALGTFGNAGRGILRFSGRNILDFSITKRTSIGEGRNLEFRAEFFNLPNHTNFGSALGRDVTVPRTFGVYTSAEDPRIIQFGLKFVF